MEGGYFELGDVVIYQNLFFNYRKRKELMFLSITYLIKLIKFYIDTYKVSKHSMASVAKFISVLTKHMHV